MLTIEQTAAQDAIAIFQLLSGKLQKTEFLAESDPSIQEAMLRSAGELLCSRHITPSNKNQVLSFLEVLKAEDLPDSLHSQIIGIIEQWNNPY